MSVEMKNLVNQNIVGIHPYNPGKPIAELEKEQGIENIIKLSSNENNRGASPKAVAALQAALSEIHRYPDGGGYYLRNRLAEKLSVDPDMLVFGNGSNELIELITRAFITEGEELIYGDPAFMVYELLAKVVGGVGVAVPLKNFTHDLEAMADRVTVKTKLIFLGNPNNPTGTSVTAADFAAFMKRLPDRVVVAVDEAYAEFAEGNPDYPDFLSYVRQGRSLMIMRTFSKFYGLAGLRIGYGIAPPAMMHYMNLVRQPFNVNMLAQVAALAALDDTVYHEETMTMVREGLAFFYREFDRLGLPYIPSVANFVLFDTKKSGKDIYQKMVADGIMGRMMDVYRLPSYLRVTCGLPAENQAFITALEKYL